MTRLTQFALVAAVLLTGAASAIAQTSDRSDRAARGASSNWSYSNEADPYNGHSPNSPEGNRAYWDYQGRHGN
jgi:hypothetical protein